MNQTTTNPNVYENLTHSSLLSLTAKEDKNMKLNFGAYRGNLSFSIFQGAGGKAWSQTIQPLSRFAILRLLMKMRDNPHVCRFPVNFSKTEPAENGKWNRVPLGSITFGIDDTKVFFIEVAFNELNNGQRLTFPVKIPSTVSFVDADISEKELLMAMIDAVINALDGEGNLARRMTSFKGNGFNSGGGNKGGGNRPGGGNWNGNRSGGNSGGGNRQFSGGAQSRNDDSYEDDVSF